MNFTELLLISVGLAMDCFAVSFWAGAVQKDLKWLYIITMAFSFGFFQAFMPVIGWFGGEAVVQYMSQFDHWIACGILGFIGGKMIVDAVRPQGDASASTDVTKIGTLLILSVATSIDALAVGFTFSVMGSVNIWFAVSVIGLVSFVLSVVGFFLGKNISAVFKPSFAQIMGGIILIAIGLKILVEHLSAA